jgi:ureidoacrylate peracid hydrolase
MHNIEISQHTLDAATRRRGGGPYAFTEINPAKTALIVIDMQNYFMEVGMAAEVPTAREIVPNINKLASKLRKAGGQVAWVISTFDEDTFKNWSVIKQLFSQSRCDAMIENLKKGAKGHALWSEFNLEDQDWTIDTLIITGTLTDVCCESSARDAMMLNFRPIMISDANAAACDEDHNNALNAMARLFADVLNTDQMLARLEKNQ